MAAVSLMPNVQIDMQALIARLYPICRSITGDGVRETLRITDRAYIVHDGGIFHSGTPATLAADEEVRRVYLGTEFRLD